MFFVLDIYEIEKYVIIVGPNIYTHWFCDFFDYIFEIYTIIVWLDTIIRLQFSFAVMVENIFFETDETKGLSKILYLNSLSFTP